MSNKLSVNPIIDGVVYVSNRSTEQVSYDDIIVEIARKIYPTDSLQMVILSDPLPQLTLAFLVSELSGKYELLIHNNNFLRYELFTRLRDGKVYKSENGENFTQLAQRALADI